MFPKNWSPNPFWNGWEFSPGQMTVVLYPVVVVTKIKLTPRSGPEPGVWQKRLICCEECPKLYYTSNDVKVHIMRVWYISVKKNYFGFPQALSLHIDAKHECVSYKCDQCNQILVYKPYLPSHQKSKYDDHKNDDDFKNKDDLKNEDDLRNEDDLKNEKDLKNEDSLEIKDDLKNEDDLKYEDNLRINTA